MRPAPIPVVDDDPREHEEWFQRLERSAQEDLRTRWRQDRLAASDRAQRRWDTTRGYLVEGALLFAFEGYTLHSTGPFVLVLSLVIGAIVGGLASYWRASTIRYVLLAGLGYVVRSLFIGLQLPGLVVTLCLFAAAGTLHQLKRCDGSEI